jgi:hypothetical protein
VARGALFEPAHVGDEALGEARDRREIVDDRAGALGEMADARIFALAAFPLGRADLGRDQFGEGAPRRDPPEPGGGRGEAVLDRLARLALVDQGHQPLAPAQALAAERDERLAAQPVALAHGGAACPAGGGPWPGRFAAVQPTAPVRHRRLAAAPARSRPRPAARREPEIARRVAVPEPPGAGRARAGGVWKIAQGGHAHRVSSLDSPVKAARLHPLRLPSDNPPVCKLSK